MLMKTIPTFASDPQKRLELIYESKSCRDCAKTSLPNYAVIEYLTF